VLAAECVVALLLLPGRSRGAVGSSHVGQCWRLLSVSAAQYPGVTRHPGGSVVFDLRLSVSVRDVLAVNLGTDS
jgi:hypothetical protein